MSLKLENEKCFAEFDEKTGILLRMGNKQTGWEVCGKKDQELFQMNVVCPYREKNTIWSHMQTLHRWELKENCLQLVYDSLSAENLGKLNLSFIAEICLKEDGFCFDGILENQSGYEVEHVAYPYFAQLEKPEGAEKFLRRNWKYAEMAEAELFPHFRNEYGYWSNEFAFQRVNVPESQFVLMEDGTQGLYVGCHDTRIPYSLEYFYELKPGMADTYSQMRKTVFDDGEIVSRVAFSATHLVFAGPGTTKELMPVVAALYQGDWQDGMECYKAWRSSWHQPIPLADWLTEVHSWYQVQMNSYGDGLRRRYADLPRLAEKCKLHGISAIQVTGWTLQGQDGCMPCHDIDPRLGTYEELRDAVKACEAMGVHVILYTKFNFADTRTEWFRKELKNYASRDRFGEIHTYSGYCYERPAILSGLNTHKIAVMCQNSAGWQKVCRTEFQKCLELNASGMLYDEPQHHHTMYMCFAEDHGHSIPAHTFAGDLTLGTQFRKMCLDAGKGDFLLSGECCYDLESNIYPFSYFRIGEECGMRTTKFATPVQRYVDSDYPYLCGVWGFNDRNTLNLCLLYRYIISYETRNFRGDPDEFPQTLEYGKKIDALRRRYAEVLWHTEFLGTHGAEVEAGEEVTYAVHRSKLTGKCAVAVANTGDTEETCRVSLSNVKSLWTVTPEMQEAVPFTGAVIIPGRSVCVIMER